MHLFQVTSFPIEQMDAERVEQRLTAWFATTRYPVRLLAFSRAFDLRPAIARLTTDQRALNQLARITAPLLTEIDRLLQGASADPAAAVARLRADELGLLLDLFSNEPSLRLLLLGDDTGDGVVGWSRLADALDSILWRVPWMKEQVRFYDALGSHHLRSASYILITWEPPDVSAASIIATLQHATGRPVRSIPQLPPILTDRYVPRAIDLQPEGLNAPWLAAGLSYDIQGQLDATLLHPLLSDTHDVALAIDIATLSTDTAQRCAELAYNAARLLAVDSRMLDTRAVGVRESARRVLFDLKHQSLHTVQLALLVGGATEEDAANAYTTTTKKLGTQIRWFRPPYTQGEILRFFSTTPRQQIEAPLRPRTSLSGGVACLAGVLGFHRADTTAGVLWGIDAVRRAGLFFDLFANNQAAHMTLLGMTGYGKTFFLNLLTLRAAVVQGYRVIGIDDFDNGPRIAATAGAGAQCYMLSMDAHTNILDIVYDEDAEGGWRTNQVQHAIAQLGLLLGRPTKTADGKDRLDAYLFSPEESGILDRALGRVYRDATPASPLDQMPLLSDLIAVLDGFREPEARRLARMLRIKLFGTEEPDADELTTVGRCFNAHTDIDWRFGADITVYNTANVPQMYRPFFYLQIIGAILRFMRDPHRDRRRRTILAIDEFGYVTQIDALARLAATITKVARKYGIGLIAIDQNPLTFLESENGRSIFENCVAKVAFRLDEKPARQLAAAVREMNESHIAALTQFNPGQCLAMVRNDIYVVNVEASPRELRAFQGS